MSVHDIAVAGFQKGSQYDDNRPSYTDEAVNIISQQIAEVDTPHGAAVNYDVLELGAGTGLFTRKLLSVLPKITRYLATDPSEGFLDTLREKSPDLETLQCAAHAIPLPDSSVKVTTCAQSFHWFSTRDALEEMRRVTVDGGKLVLIWNGKDQSQPWVSEMMTYILSLDKSRPVYNDGKHKRWNEVFEGYTGFRDERSYILPGVEYKGNHDAIVKHFSSISAVAKQNGEHREKIVKNIRDILQKYPETRDKDIIQIPLITDIKIYTCHKDNKAIVV